MSHFITIAGTEIQRTGNSHCRIILANKAQSYIKNLVSVLKKLDGEPVYFIDDQITGTSETLIASMEDNINNGLEVEKTYLYTIIKDIYDSSECCSIRIWWANDSKDAHEKLYECFSLEDFKDKIQELSCFYNIKLEKSRTKRSTLLFSATAENSK